MKNIWRKGEIIIVAVCIILLVGLCVAVIIGYMHTQKIDTDMELRCFPLLVVFCLMFPFTFNHTSFDSEKLAVHKFLRSKKELFYSDIKCIMLSYLYKRGKYKYGTYYAVTNNSKKINLYLAGRTAGGNQVLIKELLGSIIKANPAVVFEGFDDDYIAELKSNKSSNEFD
jgi:hypothetical protein